MADQRLWRCQQRGYLVGRVEGDADADIKPAVVFEDIPVEG